MSLFITALVLGAFLLGAYIWLIVLQVEVDKDTSSPDITLPVDIQVVVFNPTVLVHQETGDDSSGSIQDSTKPFRTIEGAIAGLNLANVVGEWAGTALVQVLPESYMVSNSPSWVADFGTGFGEAIVIEPLIGALVTSEVAVVEIKNAFQQPTAQNITLSNDTVTANISFVEFEDVQYTCEMVTTRVIRTTEVIPNLSVSSVVALIELTSKLIIADGAKPDISVASPTGTLRLDFFILETGSMNTFCFGKRGTSPDALVSVCNCIHMIGPMAVPGLTALSRVNFERCHSKLAEQFSVEILGQDCRVSGCILDGGLEASNGANCFVENTIAFTFAVKNGSVLTGVDCTQQHKTGVTPVTAFEALTNSQMTLTGFSQALLPNQGTTTIAHARDPGSKINISFLGVDFSGLSFCFRMDKQGQIIVDGLFGNFNDDTSLAEILNGSSLSVPNTPNLVQDKFTGTGNSTLGSDTNFPPTFDGSVKTQEACLYFGS